MSTIFSKNNKDPSPCETTHRKEACVENLAQTLIWKLGRFLDVT